MELQGESLIAAPRQRVWDALNDPEILSRCIEGVETLTRSTVDGVDRFDGKMHAKVGPVRATFAGGVALTELDPLNRYVLVGEGKGGVAGFAKGTAEVRLSDAEGGTHLAYTVNSSVGGKLAQLGARLIEGTARGYAETFFTRFKAEVEGPVIPPESTSPPLATEPLPQAPASKGISPLIWGGALILLVALLLAWQLS